MTDTLSTVSENFLNWVKTGIEESGLFPQGFKVYDNREKSLLSTINYQLDSAFNLACVVTYPNIRRIGQDPADREHEVSVKVLVVRNQLLSDIDTFTVSEKLYTLFDGARYYPDADAGMDMRLMTANVSSTGLYNESWDAEQARHQINIKATLIINH